MYSVLLSLYLIVSILLIGLILLQHGKGASMGASFGAGASNTVFGSVGSGNFLTHSTAVLATLFFLISLGITALYAHQDHGTSDFDNLQSVADKSAVEQKKEVKVEDEIPDLPSENASVGVTAIDKSAGSEKAVTAGADKSVSSELAAQGEALKDKIASEQAKASEQAAALKEQVEAQQTEAKEQAVALKEQAEAKQAEVKEHAAVLKEQVEAKQTEAKEQAVALKEQVEAKQAEVKEHAAALKEQIESKPAEVKEQAEAATTQADAVAPKVE